MPLGFGCPWLAAQPPFVLPARGSHFGVCSSDRLSRKIIARGLSFQKLATRGYRSGVQRGATVLYFALRCNTQSLFSSHLDLWSWSFRGVFPAISLRCPLSRPLAHYSAIVVHRRLLWIAMSHLMTQTAHLVPAFSTFGTVSTVYPSSDKTLRCPVPSPCIRSYTPRRSWAVQVSGVRKGCTHSHHQRSYVWYSSHQNLAAHSFH